MFYTLSLNPTLDYDVYFDGPADGSAEVNQASRVRYRPSGKGINVSKMLKNLGAESVALGFAGGFTGRHILDDLAEWGIKSDFVEVAGTTRINVKIMRGNAESEITGVAPEMTPEYTRLLMEKLNQIRPGDTLIMSGSVPSGLPGDIYRQIAGTLPGGVRTALDTRGKLLLQNIHGNYLIKPNIRELSDMYGVSVTGAREAARYGERLLAGGVENVIVSMGGEGAVLINKGGKFFAAAPKGVPVNTMGAGDSVVAGFMYGKAGGYADGEAFRLAVACGSATAFSEDIGTKELAEELYNGIEIKMI